MMSAKVHPEGEFEEIKIVYQEDKAPKQTSSEDLTTEELQFEMELDENQDPLLMIRSLHQFPTKFSSPLNPTFKNTRRNSAPKHVNMLHLKNKIKTSPDLRRKAIINSRLMNQEDSIESVLRDLALIE